MKKSCVTLALICFCSGLAWAQGYPTVGFYDTMEYTYCYGDVEVLVAKDIYGAIWLPPEIAAITACEFAISNLPESGPLGIRTDYWTTPLVIGEPVWGIALAWSEPQQGPWVLIGRLNFFMIDPAWIGDDHHMLVVETQGSYNLAIVDDHFEEHDAIGGYYHFNCTDVLDCGCFHCTGTAVTSWGSLKALY